MRATHALHSFPIARAGVRARVLLPPSLIARLRAPQLDADLAAGVAAWRSPAHTARAAQLTSRQERLSVADLLEHLLKDVIRPPAISSVVPPCREQVLAAEQAIIDVTLRLRSRDPVDPRGVARLLTLLRDGTGPCYARSSRRALASALQNATQWLDVVD
jgi:hypothetical protein